jgi:hypothetical protein
MTDGYGEPLGSPDTGLADRLVRWMADNRKGLDAMMVEEGSRAIHEEFLLAEGGTLPDRATRIERARGASARAWMRHLGHATAEVWSGADPALPEKMKRWSADHPERLEAHVLEEQAVLERRGASGDPHADQRDADLAGHCRTFAEMLASLSEPLIESSESPPDFARRVASWARSQEGHRREIEAEARAAWGSGPPPGTEQAMSAATSAPEPDEMRVAEAAAVWAHVQILAEALEHALKAAPETPA